MASRRWRSGDGSGTACLRRWCRRGSPRARPCRPPPPPRAPPPRPPSPNGKVDRSALPRPSEGIDAESSEPYAPPRTAVEGLLVGIAAELLGRDRVGVHDNFFDIGVDSILGIRLVSRARHAGLVVD